MLCISCLQTTLESVASSDTTGTSFAQSLERSVVQLHTLRVHRWSLLLRNSSPPLSYIPIHLVAFCHLPQFYWPLSNLDDGGGTKLVTISWLTRDPQDNKNFRWFSSPLDAQYTDNVHRMMICGVNEWRTEWMHACFLFLSLTPSVILQVHFRQPIVWKDQAKNQPSGPVYSSGSHASSALLICPTPQVLHVLLLGSTFLWQLYSLPCALLVGTRVRGLMSSPATFSTTNFLDWNPNYVAGPKHVAGVQHGSRVNGFPCPILKVSTF